MCAKMKLLKENITFDANKSHFHGGNALANESRCMLLSIEERQSYPMERHRKKTHTHIKREHSFDSTHVQCGIKIPLSIYNSDGTVTNESNNNNNAKHQIARASPHGSLSLSLCVIARAFALFIIKIILLHISCSLCSAHTHMTHI